MFKKPLGLLGIFLSVVGIGFLAGSAVAYAKVQDGYESLQSFSEAQNVTLTYDEDGQLVDRGSTEQADEIMALLEDDWGFPVVEGDLDPSDPLINSATEYMYQMATIAFHVLHGEQAVTLTEDQIAAAIESGALAPDGTYEGVVTEYQGQVLEPGTYTVPVDGRYWTGFTRTDILDGAARDLAWSGTAHALVAELGVGAVTHSTLQLGLGMVALLAGLGVVFTASGGLVIWEVRRRTRVTAPDTIPEDVVRSVEQEAQRASS
jgi:hypothetical protein